MLLELSDIFQNSVLSEPRDYPLENIVDDEKPTSQHIGNCRLIILENYETPSEYITSTTDSLFARVGPVSDTDPVSEFQQF